MAIRWRTRNELPVPPADYGEVLVKVDRGGSMLTHEVIPSSFCREFIEWKERNFIPWNLVAWVPLSEIDPDSSPTDGAREEG